MDCRVGFLVCDGGTWRRAIWGDCFTRCDDEEVIKSKLLSLYANDEGIGGDDGLGVNVLGFDALEIGPAD